MGLESVMSGVRPVFHVLSLSAFVCTMYHDYVHVPTAPVPGVFMSKCVWLTFCDLCIQLFYHALGAVAVLQKPSSRIVNFFDFTATCIACPVALAVVGLFWGLHTIDPEALLDEAAKKILSVVWFNHGLHTLPGVCMLLDMMLTKHRRPSHTVAFATLFTFTLIYIGIVLTVHSVSGFWAYPILGQLNVLWRAAFIAGCALFLYNLFLITDAINGFIWNHHLGMSPVSPDKKITKKKRF